MEVEGEIGVQMGDLGVEEIIWSLGGGQRKQ